MLAGTRVYIIQTPQLELEYIQCVSYLRLATDKDWFFDLFLIYPSVFHRAGDGGELNIIISAHVMNTADWSLDNPLSDIWLIM